MNGLISGVLSAFLIASTPTIIEPAHPIEEITTFDKIELDVPELVDYYATKYGVSKDLAHYIAKNESNYRVEAVGDLFPCRNTKSPNYGQDVYARGVYQITRCYHYNVSDEQAFNAEYNIEYAMKLIAQGKEVCKTQFTTCRNYYNQNPA